MDVSSRRNTTSPVMPAGSSPAHAHTTNWAAEVLRDRISAGDIPPGTRLTEVSLAEELSVSRNTLRAAFMELAAEQLVEKVPNRGTFVITPDPEFITELYRVRSFLEPAAVQWGTLTDELDRDFKQVESRVASAKTATDFASANNAFHLTVMRMTAAPLLVTTMSQLLARMRLVFHLKDEEPEFHAPYATQNVALIGLIRSGQQTKAAELLRSYLVEAEADLLELFREDPTAQ